MFKRFVENVIGTMVMTAIGLIILFTVSGVVYGIQEAIAGREVDWKTEAINMFTVKEDPIEVIEEGGVDGDSSFYFFAELTICFMKLCVFGGTVMYGIKDQMDCWDKNIDKKIVNAFINSKGRFKNEVFVIYEDGVREVIFGYDPNRMRYIHTDFIGKTKLVAVFEYDRKRNETIKDYYGHGRRY